MGSHYFQITYAPGMIPVGCRLAKWSHARKQFMLTPQEALLIGHMRLLCERFYAYKDG